jgi:anti-anti-sigma factor
MVEVSRLVISARLEEVRHACDFVVEAAETARLDERAVYHCQMAVDEALTNIIEHGYAYEGDNSQIEIICETNANHFTITIIDDSPAFDPLTHHSPDPSAPLDTREPGGWGIYFIRKLMDDVRYTRVQDRNHLKLVKNLSGAQVDAVATEVNEGFPVRNLENSSVIITPYGRLDSNTSTTLEKTLNAQLEKGQRWLHLDMSDVEYIASSGLKVLVSAWRRAHERDGDVTLSNLRPRLMEIFEMVGFDMLFQIFPDVDTALATQSKKT